MRVAKENLADVRSRVDERIEECERRCKESVAEHREIDAQVLAQRTEYYEQELTKNGCYHCKCDRCEARRNQPSSDEEEEDIFLDPKDLPVSSPLRKIQRGRGGDRRSKQFKKDALRPLRASWPCPACQLDKRRRVFRLWRLPPLATLATPINKPSEHNLRCQPACQAHGRADVRCSRQV